MIIKTHHFSPQYERHLLPDQPSIDCVRAVASDYVAILISVMTHIADRYERSAVPGLVDTKFDIITGQDFPADDPRGPQTVYGWIQGRALEALAGHATWLRHNPWADKGGQLLPRLERILAEVYEHVRAMRQKNNGRLFFFMDPTGTPFTFASDGQKLPYTLSAHAPYNFSDLFGSRGLYAAAVYLEDKTGIEEAAAYCLAVEDALWNQRFVSDQQRLPPFPNHEQQSETKHSHAPYTIQLATPALMALQQGDPEYIDRGLRLMQHVLSRHMNAPGKEPSLDRYDFWEFVDANDAPYVADGQLLADPGHAIEFVGLGLKLTRVARKVGIPADTLRPNEAPMVNLLLRSFENGFVPAVGGLYKSYDLLTYRPIDANMPWWSLPETMRAALGCWAIARTKTERQNILNVFAACHNSLATHYVRTDRHLFSVQTRSATGEIVDVIPATADADPGYHTGLCLIDVLNILEEETGSF